MALVAVIPETGRVISSVRWKEGIRRERNKTTIMSSGGGATLSFNGSTVDRGMARIGSFLVAAYTPYGSSPYT
jgi:hypothetical protein